MTCRKLQASFVVLISLVPAAGCGKSEPTSQPKCIQVPSLSDERKTKIAGEIAGKLEKVSASANVKGEYESLVKVEYAKLSDDNLALFLFLTAIECYLKEGKVGEDIAKDMAALVRKKWAAEHGIAGAEPKLSPLEQQKIDESPYAKELNPLLKKFQLRD